MIILMRPRTEALNQYLASRVDMGVYTRDADIPDPPPTGFRRNHHRGSLGRGASVFDAAKMAVTNWQQIPGGWIDVHPAGDAAHLGQTVAVVARYLGLWSVNACRVIDISESDEKSLVRFAVTYVTLADHMLQGAECFCVEWDKSDDSVCYDLSSYSRPRHWLIRVIHILVRRLQRRFARESLAALNSVLTIDSGAVTPPPDHHPKVEPV